MMVNIPKHIIDIHFRYQRPVVEAVYTKKFGKSTQIVNLDKIANAINTPVKTLIAYLRRELQCQITSVGTPLIKHHVLAKDIDDIIEKYIDIYVLCNMCKNPEFEEVISRKKIKHQCKACGHIRVI